MFDLDNCIEIFTTLRKNKLRTFLTGFSVAWGIFMLIILLASGKGLQNGIMEVFGNQSTNFVSMYAQPTGMPYKGNPKDRQIKLEQKDVELVAQMPEVENISMSLAYDLMASYNFNSSMSYFEGTTPTRAVNEGMKIVNGRFINELDMKEQRKVIVINKRMRDVFFKNEDPIGKQIEANKIIFTVVGVYEISEWENFRCRAFFPFSAAQTIFEKGRGIKEIQFTLQGVETEEAIEKFTTNVRTQMAAVHQFDPEDKRAIRFWSVIEGYMQIMGLFGAINLFILIIGAGTLIAGVVGVSNIMLISVRERTREFGIRKALGATPFSIIQSVLMESVIITSIFGYIGMVLGVGLSELVSFLIEQSSVPGERAIFKNPEVSLSVAVGATVVMVIAGMIAGYFPARKAVKITAIEAMRAE